MFRLLITIFLVQRYELTQDKVYEIKDELARRRAAAGQTPTPV